MNNWNLIRSFYRDNMNEIMNAHPMQYGVDPYWWDGIVEMTPIERSMWCDIRCVGVVFYPQYPVSNFFVDFANPQWKIAIECDGKDWHDPAKDAVRDAHLRDIGWRVFRFTGSDCNKVEEEVEDENGKITWSPPPGEKFLQELRKHMEIPYGVL